MNRSLHTIQARLQTARDSLMAQMPLHGLSQAEFEVAERVCNGRHQCRMWLDEQLDELKRVQRSQR